MWKFFSIGIICFLTFVSFNAGAIAAEGVDAPKEAVALLKKAKATKNQKKYIDTVTLLFDLYPDVRSPIADEAVSLFPAAGEAIRAMETDLAILDEGFGKLPLNEVPKVGSFFNDHSGFLTFADWKGSAEMGFSSASGDANAQAFTGGFRASRVFSKSWEHAFKMDLNFAKANGIATQEKLTSDYQVYYRNWKRGYIFGLSTFEYDKFSGFDYRLTQSFGVGYTIFDQSNLKWSIEGGPGSRESKTDIGAMEVDFVGTLNTNFRYWIQPEISLGTELKSVWGQKRFTIINIADLKARINDRFSARFSFETNYDSVVPLGTSKTDTLMKATLIYDF